VGLKSGTKYLKVGTGADGNWKAIPQSGGILGESASAVGFDASRRRRKVVESREGGRKTKGATVKIASTEKRKQV
jgi:hypothetical protein